MVLSTLTMKNNLILVARIEKQNKAAAIQPGYGLNVGWSDSQNQTHNGRWCLNLLFIILGLCPLVHLMGIAVTVKQTVQHWSRENLALELIVRQRGRFIKPSGNMLVNALMRPLLIEVVRIS